MSLRVLLALGGTAVAGPLAAVLLAWAWQPAPLPYPHALLKTGLPKAAPPAVLAAAGRPIFRLSELAGRTVWLYLGYASCPDVCPNALGFLAEEHKRLAWIITIVLWVLGFVSGLTNRAAFDNITNNLPGSQASAGTVVTRTV